MPAVRCVAVALMLNSFVLGILLSASAGGMSDAGGLTDVVGSSSTTPLFFDHSSCNLLALCFPIPVPLIQISSATCSSPSIDLRLLLM